MLPPLVMVLWLMVFPLALALSHAPAPYTVDMKLPVIVLEDEPSRSSPERTLPPIMVLKLMAFPLAL